jgi:N-acetylglucosamine-6-phosphate deacetylase
MGPSDTALVERLAKRLTRPILLVTLAPELTGGEPFIRAMTAAGRLVAIGHSAADFGTVAAAAEAGARLSTHLGNGLPQILPKLANPIFAQLAEDRLAASFIADGIHLPPASLKTLIRAKGPERSILVTDAVSAAASPPGRYEFAGMSVELAKDGSVRLPGSTSLAGSALSLDQAVRNLVAWELATASDALRMASDNPRGLVRSSAEAMGVAVPGGKVRWSDDLVPAEVSLGDLEWRFG